MPDAQQIERVLFLGSKKFGLEVARLFLRVAKEQMVGMVTINDGEDTRSELLAIRSLAEKENCPVDVLDKPRNIAPVVEKYRPDFCIVCGWYHLIPEETLNAVPHGFAGIHASLLPAYRGSSPLVWALINVESEVGYSLFKFTPGMDDGPIWLQNSINVGTDETIGEQVHNFVRAQSRPYPGAFTFVKEQKVTVWRTRLAPEPHYAVPGQIARRTGVQVFIGCGDDRAVEILEAGIDGESVAPAEVFSSFQLRLN